MNPDELAPFLGEWKLVESINFLEYLKASGAPAVICKLFKNSKPDVEIKLSKDKESVVFITKFLLKDFSIKTKINGKEHAADLPLLSGKQAKDSLTILSYDKDSGVMCIDIWSPSVASKNR